MSDHRAALATPAPEPEGMETTKTERDNWVKNVVPPHESSGFIPRLIRDFDRVAARLAPVEDETDVLSRARKLLDKHLEFSVWADGYDAKSTRLPEQTGRALAAEIAALVFAYNITKTADADRLWRGKGEAEWRPIESAPKDRTRILLGFKDIDPVVGYWGMSDGYRLLEGDDPNELAWRVDFSGDHLENLTFEPTHWQPLPAATPKAAKEE